MDEIIPIFKAHDHFFRKLMSNPRVARISGRAPAAGGATTC